MFLLDVFIMTDMAQQEKHGKNVFLYFLEMTFGNFNALYSILQYRTTVTEPLIINNIHSNFPLKCGDSLFKALIHSSDRRFTVYN